MRSHDGGDFGRILLPLAVALAVIMFVLPLTISFPLLDPDEGLHASIAQEMVERGNWTTPQFLGQPFLDKPIFFFWVQAASLRLLGPSEMAVRLPGLMFGLLGAITTGLLGGRLFGRTTGLIAGILYATTILPTALAQAASHDVALIPWVNLAILVLWEAEHARTRLGALNCLLGAGVFLGLALLTKGLLGAAVVGVAYGSYLLLALFRELRRRPTSAPCQTPLHCHGGGAAARRSVLEILRAAWRIGLAPLLGGLIVFIIAALVAAPWYALVERHNPGYLSYFFVERHVMGFATWSQPHGDAPWWYYLPVLLGGGLPWITYLPVVVQDELARRREWGAMPLLWCWLIGWTLLMLLAGSKLATYVWPVFPAMAVLAATAWTRLIDGTLGAAARRSFARTFVWASWSGPFVLPVVVLVMQIAFAVQFDWPAWVVVALAAAVAPAPLIAWRAGRWQASLAAATLSLAVQFVAVMAMVLPPVAETFSARDLARHFNRLGHLPSRLLVVEGRLGSLVFYLTPRLRAGLTTERLQQWAAKELPPLQSGDTIAVPERKIASLRAYRLFAGDPYETVGHYRLYQIAKPRPKEKPGASQ
jgi:hypothetical protein